MKYTIEGFQQQILLDLNLDGLDAIILRWIVDFYHTGKMNNFFVDGIPYFWINHDSVCRELPCLKINNKRTIGRRLDKYVTSGLMKKYVHNGNTTYYRFNETVYESLINSPMYSKVQPDVLKSTTPVTESTGGGGLKSTTYSSIKKDSSKVSSSEDTKDLKLIQSKSMDLKKQDAPPPPDLNLETKFKAMLNRWNEITGQEQVYDKKIFGYFCGAVKKHGIDKVFKAIGNYAHSEWHHHHQAWKWGAIWGQPDFIGQWATKDPRQKLDKSPEENAISDFLKHRANVNRRQKNGNDINLRSICGDADGNV